MIDSFLNVVEYQSQGLLGQVPHVLETFVSKHSQSHLPNFACLSGGDTKSNWSLLSGVYVPEEVKITHRVNV